MPEILSGELANILNFIAAASGLGIAAMGLVDASKVFGGGPSNFGVRDIRNALAPFFSRKEGVQGAFDDSAALLTIRANWINGVPKADQKAKARSLVHLCLTQGDTGKIAAAAGVDAEKMASLVKKIAAGTALTTEEMNVLGQFDAVLAAVLDAAYERADQRYRTGCKSIALGVSTLLGIFGGWIVYGNLGHQYFLSPEFGISLAIGVLGTPIAPIAKDLASSLQAAASAARLVKRA